MKENEFPHNPWASSKRICARLLMNPLFATMENNSKMNNKKTNAKKKKTRVKHFCYIYLTTMLVKQNNAKDFYLESFGFFQSLCWKSRILYWQKFKVLLEQNEPSSKVNLWSIPLNFCVNIMWKAYMTIEFTNKLL